MTDRTERAGPETEPVRKTQNPHYTVLRADPEDTSIWRRLTPEPIAAPSRTVAIRFAAAELPVEERSGTFAVILDSAWETINRVVKQRTIDEDSFESSPRANGKKGTP